jgi:hypothetical protein
MYAKWIDEDKYVGPKFRRACAIKKGEIRKVLAKHIDGSYLLEGKYPDGGGSFGWVNADQIELLDRI